MKLIILFALTVLSASGNNSLHLYKGSIIFIPVANYWKLKIYGILFFAN